MQRKIKKYEEINYGTNDKDNRRDKRNRCVR